MHFMLANRQSELAHSSYNILNFHREFSGLEDYSRGDSYPDVILT